MEKSVKISELKKGFCIFSDDETRGFFASVKRLTNYCKIAESGKEAEKSAIDFAEAEKALKEAKKAEADRKREAGKDAKKAEAYENAKGVTEEAKRKAEEARKKAENAKREASEAEKVLNGNEKARKAIANLAEIMQRKHFSSADISKDFLLKWIPERFNANNELCSVKAVKPEEEAETRANFADCPDMLIVNDDTLYIYKPIRLYTANSFLSLIMTASDKREKAGKEKVSAIEKARKEAEKAEKRAKRMESYRQKLAEYDAEIAKKAEA